LSCMRFDVFVDLPADLRLARKIQRKCVRDGFPVEVLLRNYLNHRRDAHERHVEPVRHQCDTVVDGAQDPNTLAHQIWSAIADQKLIHNS
jgi:uridine kinase